MTTALVLLVSVASSQLTRFLAVRFSVGVVRASAGSTLAFLALTSLIPYQDKDLLGAAFLGASFLGMSSVSFLSAWNLFFAAWIFAAFFLYAIPYNIGLGGALGVAAFSSCLLVRSGLRKKPRPRPAAR